MGCGPYRLIVVERGRPHAWTTHAANGLMQSAPSLPSLAFTARDPNFLRCLAWFAILLMATNCRWGLSLGDVHQVDATCRARARVHRLFGVFAAAMAVVLVDSIVVTYFIGTSRWAKEVVETYRLDPELKYAAPRRSKRGTFPWATLSMLTIVGVIALGERPRSLDLPPRHGRWAMPHLSGHRRAGIHRLGVLRSSDQHLRNHAAVDDIMAAVKRIREERGLEVQRLPLSACFRVLRDSTLLRVRARCVRVCRVRARVLQIGRHVRRARLACVPLRRDGCAWLSMCVRPQAIPNPIAAPAKA